MAEKWDKLEAEMREISLRKLSAETQNLILQNIETGRPAQGFRRFILWGSAVAACIVAGLFLWLHGRDVEPPKPGGSVAVRPETGPVVLPPLKVTELAPGWKAESRGAKYETVKPGLVRLESGELYVESIPLASPAALKIETPDGTATATGTKFYIGTHKPAVNKKGREMGRITRVLVITGLVTLANSLGTISGGPNDLLAVEKDTAPVKHVVQSNSDFAFDMYKQLSGENKGKNMFFSPYSISSALAMTAEGARGETAEEMGKVLRFPDAARRVGNDAQLIPWRTSLIHTGMSELNDRLTGEKDRAKLAAARVEIAKLRKAYEAAKARTAQVRKSRNWKEYREASAAEKKAADKLNDASAKVDQYELNIANALWGEKTYPFEDTYIKTIDKYYKTGGVFPSDFKNSFPAERERINKWVEKLTKNRIKDLIPEIPPDEARLIRLILTNAIYFKGEWSEPGLSALKVSRAPLRRNDRQA